MPTKLISKALLGILSAAAFAAPAFAGGNCGGGNCAVPVQVLPYAAPQFGAMTIQNQNPLGHLSTVNFQRAPHVSITRIHGLGPTANLSDAPSGFTGGCHPTSTSYCRQPAQSVAPAPVVSAPRIVQTGGGYDESKFIPRVYGDPTFVPGVAYLPTSTVVRDPAAAQQVLDTGRAIPQQVVVPGTGTAPHLGMMRNNGFAQGFTQSQGIRQTQGLFLAPTRQGPSYGQPGVPVLQQSGPMAGAYGSNVAADGTYWEKVSGPTAFGDTIATSVICKRQLQTRVVHPRIGVPVPVPVAVHQGCQTGGGHAAPNQRYGQAAQGRWTY